MKRLSIYATYTAGEVNTDYIIYMIEKLVTISDVYLVSNCPLMNHEKLKCSKVSGIIERNDEGYDVGAYAYALKYLDETGKLKEYEELVLLNDSIFGPFYSLKELFVEMDAKSPQADFWGITKRGINNFDGGVEVYPEHIQLYFYVIRDKMFHSTHFMKYMEQIPKEITDFRSAIIKYEFSFTHYFSELGYKYDTYCDTNLFLTENPDNNLSPYHYDIYNLISKQKCPFIKRKLFTGESVENKYTNASTLSKAIKFIDERTEYDVGLIWSHVLSAYSVIDIMKAMQMTEIIYSNDMDRYENLNDYLTSKAVPDAKKCYLISEDGYSIFIDLRIHEENNAIQQSLDELVLSNLLYGKEYIKEIESLFEKENRLGLIVPPIHSFGELENDLRGRWNSKEVFERMSNKYKLQISFKTSPLHSIAGFVIRNDILTDDLIDDIEKDTTGTILQMLPFFVQKKGYYTKILVSTSYAGALLENLTFVSKNLIANMDENEKNRNIDELKLVHACNRILCNIDPCFNVYIYGAGRQAQGIITYLKNKMDIKGIVVSDTNGNTRLISGYKVLSIEDVRDNNPFFLVAVGKKNFEDVRKVLEQKGYSNYLEIE